MIRVIIFVATTAHIGQDRRSDFFVFVFPSGLTISTVCIARELLLSKLRYRSYPTTWASNHKNTTHTQTSQADMRYNSCVLIRDMWTNGSGNPAGGTLIFF